MIQELISAKETISKYNKMLLEELLELYKKDTGIVFPQQYIDNVKFTGLTSVDCLELLIAGFSGE